MIASRAMVIVGLIVSTFVTGCRLGHSSGGMQMQTAMPDRGSGVTGPDERPPSVRDPGLSSTLPPRRAGNPYVDPNPPVSSPESHPSEGADNAGSGSDGPAKPEPTMPDMPGM